MRPSALTPILSRLRFAATTFYLAGTAGLAAVYQLLGTGGWPLAFAAVLYGCVLGVVLQSLSRAALPCLRAALASFLAACTIWVPVVLVTYGFALRATPALVAYAVSVVVGIRLVLLARRVVAVRERAP